MKSMQIVLRAGVEDLTKSRFEYNFSRLSDVAAGMLTSFEKAALSVGVEMGKTHREESFYAKAFNEAIGAGILNSERDGTVVPELVMSEAQSVALDWLHKFTKTMGEIENGDSETKEEEHVLAAYDLSQELALSLNATNTKESEAAADVVGVLLDKRKAREAHFAPKLADGSFPALWYFTAMDAMPVFMLNHLIRASKSEKGVLASGIFSSPYPSTVHNEGVRGRVRITRKQTVVPFVSAMSEMYFFDNFLEYVKSDTFKFTNVPTTSLYIMSGFSSDMWKICEYHQHITPRDVSYLVIWLCWLRVCTKFVYNNPSKYVVALSPSVISSICLVAHELMHDMGISPFSTKFIDEIGKLTIERVMGNAFASGLKERKTHHGEMFYLDSFYDHFMSNGCSALNMPWNDYESSTFRVVSVAALRRKDDKVPLLLLFHSYKLFDTHKDSVVPFIHSDDGEQVDGYFCGLGTIHNKFCSYVIDSKGKAVPVVMPVAVESSCEGEQDNIRSYHYLWALGLCRMIAATTGNTECLIGEYPEKAEYDIAANAPEEVLKYRTVVRKFVHSARVDGSTFTYI